MQGTRFGKYWIDRMLAAGGMAEVYQAHSSSGVYVAIKKILPLMAEQAKFIQMFIDEARIIIRLKHPNVVQLLDFGKIDSTYFLSMEWIDGKSLAELVLQQRQLQVPFPIDVAILLTIDICEGLAYAHARTDSFDRPLHIVHRDISPPNILVTRTGIAKVADFGIADMRDKAIRTQPGVIRGKFSYMSPEQSRGESVDHRSDIFAVGVVIYEMLMGTRLFLREKEVLTIEAVRNCEVPPMREKRFQISTELEMAIRKALSPLATDRYNSATEFSDRLRSILKAEYPMATRDTIVEFMKYLYPNERFYRSTSYPGITQPFEDSFSKPAREFARTGWRQRITAHPYVVAAVIGLLVILLAEMLVHWVQ